MSKDFYIKTLIQKYIKYKNFLKTRKCVSVTGVTDERTDAQTENLYVTQQSWRGAKKYI